MSTIAINHGVHYNTGNTAKKMTLAERYMNYVENNSEYLAVYTAAMCRSGYVAAKIMSDYRDSRRNKALA